ncbi:hypothetical protein D3C84_302690 [compost metagenome]
MERPTKSKTSASTFTGFMPAFRLTSEICVVGIQSEIKFSILFTSATAKSIYSFAFTVSLATTVTSKGLPNIDNFLLCAICPNELTEISKRPINTFFFIIFRMNE